MNSYETFMMTILSLAVCLISAMVLVVLALIMSTPIGAQPASADPAGVPLLEPSQNLILHGQVQLQGNRDYRQVTVTIATRQVETNSNGEFELEVAGPYVLTATASGYLGARVEVEPMAEASPSSSIFNLGSVTLLAGDVTGDNRIDLTDLTFIADHLGTPDELADLNDDGLVDILDLALAAANYGQNGPITQWQS